jgi:hypothetical protein|nr:hypothetical protein [Neorhizobium tomejilense]
MGGLLKDRILKVVTNERAMEASRSAFALEVENSRATFQAMMDSLYTEDLFGFHRAVQDEIDRPSFDASFEMACRKNPLVAASARREALRGGSCIPGRGARPGVEAMTDLFFLPITGPSSQIQKIASDVLVMTAMENAFLDSGVMAEAATLTLSATPVRPDSVVNATPGGLREVAQAFNDFRYANRPANRRGRLEAAIEDFETVCDNLSDVRTARGTVTMLIAGSYAREYDTSGPLVPDGLTMQIANCDFGDEHKEALDSLTAKLSEIAGMEVGRPHWLGRACAAAAVQNTMAIFEAEAKFYGLDVRENGFDGVGIVQRGDTTLVEASLDEISLGPVPYPSKLAELDPSYPVEAFGDIAKEAIPCGHLEHGRSAYLN